MLRGNGVRPRFPTGYGLWYDLGPLQRGVFSFYASACPRAHRIMDEGDADLRKHHLEFPAAPDETAASSSPRQELQLP